MQAAQDILASHGIATVDDMAIGDRVEVDLDRWVMTFVIEKRDTDQVSVGQYYTRYGDRIRDPEIVFRTDGTTWIPIEYTQHPHIHRYDEEGLPDVKGFVKQWSRNLTLLGFVNAINQQRQARVINQ